MICYNSQKLASINFKIFIPLCGYPKCQVTLILSLAERSNVAFPRFIPHGEPFNVPVLKTLHLKSIGLKHTLDRSFS